MSLKKQPTGIDGQIVYWYRYHESSAIMPQTFDGLDKEVDNVLSMDHLQIWHNNEVKTYSGDENRNHTVQLRETMKVFELVSKENISWKKREKKDVHIGAQAQEAKLRRYSWQE
ncbi:hypothetical protein M378DRAFT_10652 [Amanita muscaria Koide BX008]|uniref:Uncharacterized protein n=1 Tax=Amanita muscaria (strain Koide BX008) TaxID=946122 RepID=A0A0C2TG20_AMAMK|nr:hypothetical protein M378DRAFT_10652 [Amanita muscaria Koide BX008]